MSEVNFNYKGNNTIIQCNSNEKMKDICKRFITKVGIDINKVYFLYNGNKIKEELTFEENLNIDDKKRNKMNIIVNIIDNEEENKLIIK